MSSFQNFLHDSWQSHDPFFHLVRLCAEEAVALSFFRRRAASSAPANRWQLLCSEGIAEVLGVRQHKVFCLELVRYM